MNRQTNQFQDWDDIEVMPEWMVLILILIMILKDDIDRMILKGQAWAARRRIGQMGAKLSAQ